MKKQLVLLRQDFLENNKVISHLPWLPENSHNTLHQCVTISKHALKTQQTHKKKKQRRSNQLRNNNGAVALIKLIIDEQFKNNIQKCFSKSKVK